MESIALKPLFRTIALFCLAIVAASCGSQKANIVTVKKRTPGAVATSSKMNLPKSSKIVKISPKAIKDLNEDTTVDQVNLEEETTVVYSSGLAADAITAAESYLGTRYRYAGNSYSGIDCSGLMHESFKQAGLIIPRTSGGIMKATSPVLLNKVQPGDLLFFATGRGRARVSHVGMVTRNDDGNIEFIHASTSQGVIKSMLSEDYWQRAYLRAGRLEE